MNKIRRVLSLLAIVMPLASEAATSFSETQTDKIKCQNVNGASQCAIETSGKFHAKFQMPTLSLIDRGIYGLSLSTYVTLTVGDFDFAGSVEEAAKYSNYSATWNDYHGNCGSGGLCKQFIKDTTVVGKVGMRMSSLTISGSNKVNGEMPFGKSIFSALCRGKLNGESFSEPVEFSIDGEIFTSTATGTCSIKTTKKTKNAQTFDLTSIVVKGSIGDLQ